MYFCPTHTGMSTFSLAFSDTGMAGGWWLVAIMVASGYGGRWYSRSQKDHPLPRPLRGKTDLVVVAVQGTPGYSTLRYCGYANHGNAENSDPREGKLLLTLCVSP
jgi:hypothetical protein